MNNSEKTNEGPACACGKADLYDEWLKQIEDRKNQVASTPISQDVDLKSSSDIAGIGDTKPDQPKV
jgi:hypothetical protein